MGLRYPVLMVGRRRGQWSSHPQKASVLSEVLGVLLVNCINKTHFRRTLERRHLSDVIQPGTMHITENCRTKNTAVRGIFLDHK